jgi:hypothetical protein
MRLEEKRQNVENFLEIIAISTEGDKFLVSVKDEDKIRIFEVKELNQVGGYYIRHIEGA